MVEEKRHLIEVLKDAKKAILKKDVTTLRDLSNMTIHSASVEQTDIYISIAIFLYSLSKIYERSDYQFYKTWNLFNKDCLIFIDKGISYLEKDNLNGFKEEIKIFFKIISKLDPKFKKSVEYVIYKARISKASRLHEHGISLGRTAEILGVSQFDLQEYVGQTGIADARECSICKNVIKRLDIARGLFK